MAKRNKLYRLLSLLLAFLFLMTSFSSVIFASDSLGSGTSGTTAEGSGESANTGWDNTISVLRLTVVPIYPETFEVGADFGYFVVNSNWLACPSNITSIDGSGLSKVDYWNADNWYYFRSNQDSTPIYWGTGNTCVEVPVYSTRSTEQRTLCTDLGVSTFTIQNYNDPLENYGDNYKNPDNWFFNHFPVLQEMYNTYGSMDEGHWSYVVVVEGIAQYHDAEHKYAFTYQQRESATYLSIFTSIDSGSTEYNQIENSRINGVRSPFQSEGFSYSPAPQGYVMYGDLSSVVGTNDSAVGNIIVEYQGEPNTNNSDQFKVATTVDKTVVVNETESLGYWNGSSFVAAEDAEHLLGVTDTDVSLDDDTYSIIFADAYRFTLGSQDTTIDNFISIGNALSGFTINWGNAKTTSGDVNIGYKYSPVSLNNYDSTYSIATKFRDALNIGASFTSAYSDTVVDRTDSTVGALCLENMRSYAWSLARQDGSGNDNVAVDQGKINANTSIGVGIEFLVKGAPVTSSKVTITLTVTDTGSLVSSSQTWSDTYTTASESTCEMTTGAACYAVVPNSSAATDTLVANLQDIVVANINDIKTRVDNSLSNIVVSDTSIPGNIGVGCTDDGNNEGYTIYEIIVNDSRNVTGDLVLPAYMLNIYYNNVIKTSSSDVVSYFINKQWTDYYNVSGHYSCLIPGEHANKTCSINGGDYYNGSDIVNVDGSSDETNAYNVTYTDTSSGTKSVNWDNALTGYYFPKSSAAYSDLTRSAAKSGLVVETFSLSGQNDSTRLDYAFNLVRAEAEDLRSVSGIHYKSYDGIGDTNNVLRIKDCFGVVPKIVVAASSTRSSWASVGDPEQETLSFTSKFTITGSTNTHVYSSHHHSSHSTGSHEEGDYRSCGGFTYYTLKNGSSLASIISKIGATSYEFTYTWSNVVLKYETEKIDTGTNDTLASNSMKSLTSSIRTKSTDGKLTSSNGYKHAAVFDNNIVLKFYPEVLMAYKNGGTKFSYDNYSTVYTMGEVERTTESSSLYLFTINGVDSGNNVTGTTYSDSMLGGTSVLGKSSITIPEGADVDVIADPSSIKINLYGYALDIVDASKDSTMKNGKNTTSEYSSIVVSGEDVYSAWGNSSSNHDTLFSNFKTWVQSIMDVDNFDADFRLTVQKNGTSETMQNFGATIGNTQLGSFAEDGVYELVISNGALDTSAGDYKAMIQQIEDDYNCSESEAKALFNASGIVSSILNSIESSTSYSMNASGTAIPSSILTNVDATSLEGSSADWTNSLGSNGNWYDEKTRTFVVRRYTCVDCTFNDITASDKIDYSSNWGGSSTSSNSTLNASWTLDIFFNEDKSSTVNDLLLNSSDYYVPEDNNLSSANNSYTVLVNNIPVANADFLLSGSSTSDFNH